jgi:hypothetical protein
LTGIPGIPDPITYRKVAVRLEPFLADSLDEPGDGSILISSGSEEGVPDFGDGPDADAGVLSVS